ncbi:MAG: hypothetical protein GX249_11885, partial [Firmicutes bacterium]|nr:hypothetical protein [Bacillota bacterium]
KRTPNRSDPPWRFLAGVLYGGRFPGGHRYELIKGSERREMELIPEEAFREAMANALVHRTWDVSPHILVGFHQEKIEIRSPGGLMAGLSGDEFLNGQISMLRNPIIGNVFFRLKYIEMFATV